MPLNIDSFRNIASQTKFGSRDIAVQGQGEDATARLGNFVFSEGAKTNDATMTAFKHALEKEYGVFGTHAFDSVLGSRAQMHKSLFDNMGIIFEQMMPEDGEKRAALMDVLDDMLVDFEDTILGKGGDYYNRIGNEIMIDARDIQ